MVLTHTSALTHSIMLTESISWREKGKIVGNLESIEGGKAKQKADDPGR